MARAHFVKSARKDNPVAKKGESYWWWKPMIGGRGGAKRFSKEQPTRSQLTQSEFLSSLYALEDDMAAAQAPEDFASIAEALRELGQEQEEKYDNMPEGLQQGGTGETLQERASGCESWADEIEAAGSELESELESVDAAWEAWQEFDRADEEYDDSDPDAEEPEEPSEDRPEGSTAEEARQAVIDDKRSVFDNNPF